MLTRHPAKVVRPESAAAEERRALSCRPMGKHTLGRSSESADLFHESPVTSHESPLLRYTGTVRPA